MSHYTHGYICRNVLNQTHDILTQIDILLIRLCRSSSVFIYLFIYLFCMKQRTGVTFLLIFRELYLGRDIWVPSCFRGFIKHGWSGDSWSIETVIVKSKAPKCGWTLYFTIFITISCWLSLIYVSYLYLSTLQLKLNILYSLAIYLRTRGINNIIENDLHFAYSGMSHYMVYVGYSV